MADKNQTDKMARKEYEKNHRLVDAQRRQREANDRRQREDRNRQTDKYRKK